MDGREGPARSVDRKSDAEKDVTTVEAEALAGVFVNGSDRTTVVEYARFWAAARPTAKGLFRPDLRPAQSPLSPVPRPIFGTPVPQNTRCQNLWFPKSITRSRKVRFSLGADLCMHAPPTVRKHVPLQPAQQCL